MPLKVSAIPSVLLECTCPSGEMEKSPSGLCGGLGTNQICANRLDVCRDVAACRAALKSISVKTSPLMTRKGASPSKGRAVAIPPAVSSPPVDSGE